MNIIVRTKEELVNAILQEIIKNGYNCSLNHIDVSHISDMSNLFKYSKFNGNISMWNTSNVIHMFAMFYNSDFNGDISNWNVSKVCDMTYMFENSKFHQDLSQWTPYSLRFDEDMFKNSLAKKPYWQDLKLEHRIIAIEHYKLNNFLIEKQHKKKVKI